MKRQLPIQINEMQLVRALRKTIENRLRKTFEDTVDCEVDARISAADDALGGSGLGTFGDILAEEMREDYEKEFEEGLSPFDL
jgi:hypothetical protein